LRHVPLDAQVHLVAVVFGIEEADPEDVAMRDFLLDADAFVNEATVEFTTVIQRLDPPRDLMRDFGVVRACRPRFGTNSWCSSSGCPDTH
jgi:hypothetical protein